MASMTASAERDETRFIESAGQRVRYRDRGDGPPLLMIHGLGAPLEFWRPLESRLGDFRTITLDPPGSGRSSVPDGRFTMGHFAQVLEDVLTHVGVASANVLGLSLGGMMAQELAHRSPERVRRLVLVSTSSQRTFSARALLASATRRRSLATPAEGDASLAGLQLELLREFGPPGRGFLLQLRTGLTWTSRPWLAELEMPVLAIAGDRDTVVPVASARRIAKTVRDGRLEVLHGAGHLCVLRRPEAAARLIRAFLLED